MRGATPPRNPPPALAILTTMANPSELIDARIQDLNDWRGETLAHIRHLIKQADPDVVEECPTWSRNGRGEASRCGITPD